MTDYEIAEFLEDNGMNLDTDYLEAIRTIYNKGFSEGHDVGLRRGLKEVYKEAE